MTAISNYSAYMRLQGQTSYTAADAAQTLSRALASPEQATRMLLTAGIVLDTEQRKQLKTWQDSGDVLSAQNFLLDQMGKLTGIANVEKTTATGKERQFQQQIEKSHETIGQYLETFKLAFIDKVKEAWAFITTTFQPVMNELEDTYKRHKETIDLLAKFIIEVLVVALVLLVKWIAAATEGVIKQIDKFLDLVDAIKKNISPYLLILADNIKLIGDNLKGVIDWIDKTIGKLGDLAKKATSGINLSGILGINGRASGGYASGLTLVGEQGPELVNLPSGSYVHSNSESQGMAGNTVNIYNPSIGNQMDLNNIIDQIKRALGRENELARLGAI
jgi:hypothetical protein